MVDRKDVTFYVNTDKIFGASKDKQMCEDFVDAFKKAGFKAKYCGRSPNIHSHPEKYNCTGKNDVWTIVVGGDDAGMWQDMLEKYFQDRLKKASICLVRVFNPGGISKKAKDRNGLKVIRKEYPDKKFKDIKGNVGEWLTKHGYSWFEGSPKTIVNQIKSSTIEGKGFSFMVGEDSSQSTKTITTTEEWKWGYSNSNPFKGYLEIEYTIDKPFGHYSNPPVKKINVDFSIEAPEATNTNIINGKVINPSFNNKIPSWVNDTVRENSFNLLEHIKDAEGDFGATDTKLYFLHKVSFKAEFKDNIQEVTEKDSTTGKETKKTTNVIYDKFDNASYKMNLYSIGLYKGDIVTAKNVNSAGKKVNSVIQDIIKDSDVYSKMNYGLYRFNDYISFNKIKEGETKPVFDFYDMEHWDKDNKNIIVDGNIIDLSNISYTPINDTLNNSMFIFKGRYDILRDEETMSYYYQRFCDLDKVLKFGEQTLMNSDTSNNNSNTEAFVSAKKYFFNNYDERRSYTIKVLGVPPVYINDYVCTHMDNPNLNSGNNGLRVASIEYEFNPKERPVIQTTLGLGKPDKKFVIEEQRKTRNRGEELNIGKNIGYNDIMDLGGLV